MLLHDRHLCTHTHAHTHPHTHVGEGGGEGYDLALRQHPQSLPRTINHFPVGSPHLPELDQLITAHLIQRPKPGWLRCFYFNNRNELNKQSQLSKKCIKFNHRELLRLQAKFIRFHLIPASAPTAKAVILKFSYGGCTGELCKQTKLKQEPGRPSAH